jgi:5'-nucleotidase
MEIEKENSKEKFENIIIVDNERLESLKNEISEDGILKFYVISDFDRTLTKLFVNGEKIHSLISILRNGDYLVPEYGEQAKALFNQYHPIEIDPKIPLIEKKKITEEWWKRHFEVLIKFGLNKKHIEKIIDSGKIKLREGGLEFLDFLYQNQIPLLIISSSGLGNEAISQVLKKEGKLYSNIYIISNFLEWDEKGNFIGAKEPIIHSMNKNGSLIKKLPIFKIIKNKRNLLLLGDNIEDCQMIDGLDYKNVIKIGFLNEEIDKNLNVYKNNFDVLILNDGDMNYLNNLLREIVY